jgi:hypothetical protein
MGMNSIIPFFAKRKFKISEPRFIAHAYLLGQILFPSVSFAVDSIRVNYTVECEDAARRTLKIRAKIQGLPAEEIPLTLPDSRVTSLELFTVEGEDEKQTEPLQESSDAPLGRNILLRGKPSESVSVKYQISLSDRLSPDRHSYGDGKRCIIYASDLLLGFGDREARTGISFDLPPAWIVVANAKNTGKGVYAVGGKQDVVFYLGTASGQQNTFGQTEVALAIEPGWEVVKEKIINSLRRQILYREKTSKDVKSGSLLIALLESTKKAGELRIVTLENSTGLVASTSPAWLKAAEFGEMVEREISKSLIPCFFPGLRNSKESSAESFILEYLMLKTEMKTGVLPKEQFLQKIAVGFGRMAEESRRSPKRSNVLSPKAVARVALSKEEKISNLFLLDLLLGFYGKSTSSLEQLIHSKMNSVLFEKIVEGEPPRNLFRDAGFLIQQRIVFPKGEAEDISKRLRPFGLVFEMRELADLSFDLNENFQIERIPKKREGDDRPLLLGDKIIAIDEQRILRPVDLLKCRSAMHPGDEITLLIERSGALQKIKQRVGRETIVRLEPNRLSDLDKQEKLEAFWVREVDQ